MRLWKGEEMQNKAVLKNRSFLTRKYYIRMMDAVLKQMQEQIEKARLGG